MKFHLKYLAYGLIAFTALGAGVYFGMGTYAPAPAPAQTTRLFEQIFPNSQGQPQALAQWRGKILVVNFWAPWCPPCVEEMPELATWQHQMQGRNVQLIGIGVDSAANISAFMAKNKNIDYPLLVAGAAGIELSQQLGNPQGGLPYTVVIDAQGRVKYQKSGRIALPELTQLAQSLLAESATEASDAPGKP